MSFNTFNIAASAQQVHDILDRLILAFPCRPRCTKFTSCGDTQKGRRMAVFIQLKNGSDFDTSPWISGLRLKGCLGASEDTVRLH